MLSNPKWLGLLAVAFVAGSFVASPELRAFAANTVGSTDIINESILSEDIKNSQVKAADIATDAVGAAEIQGVTKLLFAKCALTSTEASTVDQPGTIRVIDCTIAGVTSTDQVVATFNSGFNCFGVTKAVPLSGEVEVYITNHCTIADKPGTGAFISLIVFKK